MSLPEHFEGWDVKRAATFRVLVHLWRFADNAQAEVWCFRTDAEVIESCSLRDERHLRECLRDLRLAEVAMRETGPDGRSGFRLYNRAPVSGGKPPAELRRRKAAALPAESRRPSGGTPPPHLVREQKSQRTEGAPPDGAAHSGPSPADIPPRGETQTSLLPDETPAPKPTPKRRHKSARQKAEDKVTARRDRAAELKADPMHPKWERILAAFNRDVRARAGRSPQRFGERWTAESREWIEDRGIPVEEIEQMIECLGMTIDAYQCADRTMPKCLYDINLVWGQVLTNAFSEHSSKLVDDSTPDRRDMAPIY